MEYRNLIVGFITLIILAFISFGIYRVYQLRVQEEERTTMVQEEAIPSPDVSFPSPEPATSPQIQGEATGPQIQPESGASQRANGSVSIITPQYNQLLSSPILISGYANTSEFFLTLSDENGKILASKKVQGCISQYPCQFKESINFQNSTTKTGTLEISATNEISPLVIPVTF